MKALLQVLTLFILTIYPAHAATPIGIRGTIVWGGPLNNEYGVLVQLGEVEFKNDNGAVTLFSGQGAFTPDPYTSPRKIGGWTDDLVNRAVRMVTFENKDAVEEKLNAAKEKNTP